MEYVSKLSFICILFTATATAQADEVKLCNGRYTNQSCDESQKNSTADKKVMSPIEAQDLREKRSLYHDLDMQVAKARREYSIRHNIESVRRICFEEIGPLEKCRREIELSEDRLNDKVDIEVRKLAVENPRKERSTDTKSQSQETQQTQTVVIVNNNSGYGRRVYPRGGYPYIDNTRSGSFETQGYNIQVGAQGGGTSVSGGISGTSGTYQGSGNNMGLGRSTRPSSGHFGR